MLISDAITGALGGKTNQAKLHALVNDIYGNFLVSLVEIIIITAM